MIKYEDFKKKVVDKATRERFILSAIPIEDRQYIALEIQQLPRKATILEIGTFAAGTTRFMAEIRPDIHVFSADINTWDPQDQLLRYVRHKYDLDFVNDDVVKMLQRINIEHLNNVTLMTCEALKVTNPEYIDLLYLDGDHGYEAVLAELRYFYDRIKYNGLIMGDDVNSQDVYDAVRTFCIEKNLEYSIYSKTFKIRKPKKNLVRHNQQIGENKVRHSPFLLPERD